MKLIILLLVLAALGAITFIVTSWIIAMAFAFITDLCSYGVLIANGDGDSKPVHFIALLLLVALGVFAVSRMF
ncbi:MAG: hypothetical protein C5B50_17675 [Verrucomicrobia bacterium]|nr:MAG: hypothetical protein C5B50_17675 [Verrucomicrobiota bacterium]